MRPTRQSSIHSKRHQKMVALLVKIRIQLGLSQTELADAIRMKQPDISKIENNERRLDVIEFLDIVRYLSQRNNKPELIRELIDQLLVEDE